MKGSERGGFVCSKCIVRSGAHCLKIFCFFHPSHLKTGGRLFEVKQPVLKGEIKNSLIHSFGDEKQQMLES